MASSPGRREPLLPPEPALRCRCIWCGDEIYEGEYAYEGRDGLLHRECLLPQLTARFRERDLAALCGYWEVIT